ncbi:amino acid:proton symporter [Pandoraea iniqua]|uniref:Amino acid:proton symporter n=1 Tax=Pandoraea iniqua TaxID=2508288 RepID=A0A5E4YIL5_9BURK|nr:APC family permease [Pandoraea iniqua]VVE48629.1 amino acid:proton symporter [Pandoraea iniqua]
MYQPPGKRSVGTVALMFTGLGSIVGSGWLFGAWRAAQIAGPAAIFAWVIGALVITVIALTYIELGAMFPESGGMVRYARYSHGSLVGFISAWANWISIVAVIPIEAIASVQYMASWPFPWTRALYTHGELTAPGLGLSAMLILVYFALNYWGVKVFIRCNGAITVFKILVPAMTVGALVWGGLHAENFASGGASAFAPHGWAAVFTAVATSGIVFSFNGFQSPLSLAGEAKHPTRSLPIAVIGAILIALILYISLQVAFIGAVEPKSIAGGWQVLNFTSPFAQLALALNLNWLVMLLYVDAFVSPSGTGAIYTATTARMIQAMERNNTMPKLFGRTHALYDVPRPAMWFNLAVSFLFLYVFRGWGALAAVISVATVISYLSGPVSLMSLRKHAPDITRPLRLRAMGGIAPFAFVCASLVLYWARWPLTGELVLLMFAAMPCYLYYQFKDGWFDFRSELRSAWWMILYMPTMAVLSFCGSAAYGGQGYLDGGWDFVAVAVIGLVFYGWGVRSGRRTRYLTESPASLPAVVEVDPCDEVASHESCKLGLVRAHASTVAS